MWRRMFTTWNRSAYVQVKIQSREQLTEEEDESNAEQDQNVRNVHDSSTFEQQHLFFGGTHEQETGGVQKLVLLVQWFIIFRKKG